MESISYTGRDIEDIRQSLIDLVPKLTDNWRDFNESDLGITIIELIAGAQDMQNFYLDNQTFETYIDTAVQDKNIRAILRAMNYRVPLPVSARSEVTLEYFGELDDTYSLPKYTRFMCRDLPGIQYISSDRTSLLEGSTSSVVSVIEGEFKEEIVTKRKLAENITVSNNVSRRIYLSNLNVADRTVNIIQQGYVWEECDDALLKYDGGRYFSVHKDVEGKVYLLMSVNFMDLMPNDADEEVYIQYIVTRGIDGLVDAYQINQIEELDILQNKIRDVYNKEAAYGATNEPNLKAAKILAREHAQTMGRYITVEDYANGVATEPTIMYSVAKDWKTTHLVRTPFTVYVWAVNQQGENLGVEEQKSLLKKFKDKGISAVSVEYQVTEFIYYDVSVVIALKPVTETEKIDIVGNITNYILDVLSYKNINYGGRLSISLLTSSIYTISPYLKSVVVENPTADVEANEIQLLRLRNVSVRVNEED